MSERSLTFTEIKKEEILQAIHDGVARGIEKLEPRMAQLEAQFKFMAPSYDRETAAEYCNRSVTWIDKQRTAVNLPHVEVSGSPRFRKEDLDHLLLGGTFTETGQQTPTKKSA